jgi:hypothetical protein
MDNFVEVQVLKCHKDATGEKPCLLLYKLMVPADVVAEVAARHEVHD